MSERGDLRVAVKASLDVPGETRRQTYVFLAWALCLAVAVVLRVAFGTHIPVSYVVSPEAEQAEIARSHAAGLKIALVVGLLCPLLLTAYITRRFRRGGAHARGIQVEVTSGGELRVWGRGYGSRVRLTGATMTERFVDLYAGRLGTWRERRMRVGTGLHMIEVGTPAREDDPDLRAEGGEGDCIEVDHDDYLALRDGVLRAIGEPPVEVRAKQG